MTDQSKGPPAGWVLPEEGPTSEMISSNSNSQHDRREQQNQHYHNDDDNHHHHHHHHHHHEENNQQLAPVGSNNDQQDSMDKTADGHGRSPSQAKQNAKQQKKWNRRLRIAFCCLGPKKNKDSIADVASIFAEFYSDLNAPSSDLAAGFVLLSKYQAAQRQWIVKNPRAHGLAIDQYLSNIPIREDTKFLDISRAADSHLINDLIYYMNYSLAIFGWPLQVIDDPCMLCCIYPYLRLAPCCLSSKRRRRLDGSEVVKEEEEKKKRKEKQKDEKQRTKKKNTRKKRRDCVEDVNSETQQEQTATSGNANNHDEQIEAIDSGATNDKIDFDENNNNNNNHFESNKCNGDEKLSQARKPITRQEEIATSKGVPGQLNDDCDMPVILEDNCCGCNSASAERRLAQHNYEIIYISYKSKVNVVPFLVAADHSKRTVVVAIRGSMSLSDMVTDMNGTVDKLPIENCPDDWLCHRGITRAAMYVRQTLMDEQILERAFASRPDLGSNNYSLVLCGHSLGAGAAGILGVLMRPLYPSLRAYLYSPPGGILSLPVVEYTKEFAIGIILGNDTVPRLGVAQLERLRYHTLLSLKSAQKSPSKILARALCPSMCVGRNKVDYDPDQSLDLLHGTDGRAFDYNDTKIPFQVQPQVLYVPGKLIHVVKNYSFKSKTQRLWSGPIYQAVWTDNTNYDRIMVSEGMFFDHLPNNLMSAMKMLFSRTLPGRREAHAGVAARQPADTMTSTPSSSSPSPPPTLPSPSAMKRNGPPRAAVTIATVAATVAVPSDGAKVKGGAEMNDQMAAELNIDSIVHCATNEQMGRSPQMQLARKANGDDDDGDDEQLLCAVNNDQQPPTSEKKNVVGEDGNNNNEDENNNNNNSPELVMNVNSLSRL